MKGKLLTALAAVAVVACLASGAWAEVAYNDFNDAAGANDPNVTNVTEIGFPTPSGNLIDVTTGSVVGLLSISVANQNGGGAAFPPASPGAAAFGSYIDPVGAITNAVAENMVISGLDPAKTYELAIYCDRDGAGSDIVLILSGADSFVNSSSLGTTISTTTVTNDTTATPRNNNGGELVNFTAIDPGADGAIRIDMTGAVDGRWYMNAMKLTVVPEPATMGLLGLGGLALLRRRR